MLRRSPQLALAFRTWGGARPGAGRKPKGDKPGVPHARRPVLAHRYPAHVTLKVARGLPTLRAERCMKVLRAACGGGRDRFGFRLCHYSVQADHIHIIAEASSAGSLSRGVQGLCVRIARRLNGELGRRGRVFADRFHSRPLKTPREVRNALAYVLLNTRHHRAARRANSVMAPSPPDPCSSGERFDGWRAASYARGPRAGPVENTVAGAKTWLLRHGWRRHGLLDPAGVPGLPR